MQYIKKDTHHIWKASTNQQETSNNKHEEENELSSNSIGCTKAI